MRGGPGPLCAIVMPTSVADIAPARAWRERLRRARPGDHNVTVMPDTPQRHTAPGIPDVADPLLLFREWMAEAGQSEPNDPNSMSLATATPDGRPSVRMVLLKGADERGFVFYTNRQSRKGG